MEANTKQLEALFDPSVQYLVPLFQRPYVWKEKPNWELLWEDVQDLLDRRLHTGKAHPHFMGAIVLEQVPNPAGSVETRLVIDGQQRFTTLQIFLAVARNLCAEHGVDKMASRFAALVRNNEDRIDHESERYKLLPTNSDRPAFAIVMDARSEHEVEKMLHEHPDQRSSKLIEASAYFTRKLRAWLAGSLDDTYDDDLESNTVEDRVEVLWQVAKGSLQLVVINLTAGDETQVIFETLNATGEALLPADLIKNYLFRNIARMEGMGEREMEKLYTKHWERFDSDFWRKEVKQGRIYRPRIDLFINHYLSMMTRDEVKSTHLFNAYKDFVERATQAPTSSIETPQTPEGHLKQLAKFADLFRKFYEPGSHETLALFMRRLEAVDTATVYPFLLYAYVRLMPNNQLEFDRVLGVLESFLMRRLITNWTTKNYNRLFVDLIRSLEKQGPLTAEAVAKQLAPNKGDSTRFPDDMELLTAVMERELYGRLSQRKVRAVLEALDAASHSSKSETLAFTEKLTIEHVLPQRWETHWPLATKVKADPVAEEKARARRKVLLNTLGNLTLITGKFNASLQNEAWSKKRPELLTYSRLNLTRYFRRPEADIWDEAAILARSEALLGQLLKIWPDIPRSTPEAHTEAS